MSMDYCFGIDIGGTAVKLALVQADGTPLARWEIPTRKGDTPEGLLRDVRAELFACMAARQIEAAQVLGVGMAAPGPVTADGVLHGAVNIGWGDVALGAEAERILGLAPVRIGNDARVAALGEALYGAGIGAESMLMVTLGTGVGGGVVLRGRILTGQSGVAGEIGHMTIDPYETKSCTCGKKGCLEQYASATGMVRLAAAGLRRGEASILRGKEPLTAQVIWAAAAAGDALANAVVDFACERLGMALANAVYLVDPQRIVIGGGVAAAGDFLLEKVRAAYRRQVFSHARVREIVLAQLGNDAGVRGAAALILQAADIG